MNRTTFFKSLAALGVAMWSKPMKVFAKSSNDVTKDKVLELIREAKKLCVKEKQWHWGAIIRELEKSINSNNKDG